MFDFWKRGLLFVGIPVLTIGILTFIDFKYIAPKSTILWSSAICDKINRLDSINTPKIILVGNSNVLMGFNSKILEDSLSYSVVNLGLIEPMGNALLENVSKSNIRKNDIVVVCHSTYSDNGKINNKQKFWLFWEHKLDLIKLVEPSDFPQIMVNVFAHYYDKVKFFRMLKSKKFGLNLQKKDVNKYGDCALERSKVSNDLFKIFDKSHPEINDICIERLNNFAEFIESKGAKLVFAGYPIFENDSIKVNRGYLKSFKDSLSKVVKGEVISNYCDYIFNEDLFYETSLHLNSEGAEIRTLQLLKDIKNSKTWKELNSR